MKNLFLTTFCIAIAVTSQGQASPNYQNGIYVSYYETTAFNVDERDKIKEANIKTERRIEVSDKKGEILELEQTFNKEGAVSYVKKKKYNRKNKYTNINYAYNNKGKLSNSESILPNNDKRLVNYKYNDSGYRTEYSLFSEKKGLMRKVETEYNGRLITQQKHYYNTSNAPKFRWTYQFHEDSSRKETEYFKKNKLKYTWNYECDPAGKIAQEKHKDTSTVCIRKETDANGNLITYTQTTNQKGEITIAKNTYNKDNVLFKSEVTSLNGTPISYWENTKESRTYRRYRKGKLRFENISEFDDNGNEVKYIYNHKNKKWSSVRLYAYDSKGLMAEAKRYDHKNRLKSTYRYEREFY